MDEVLLLGVGDAHGDLEALFAAAAREPEARAILQVGDLTAGKPGRESRPDDDPARLSALPVPLVWVHGNHEHWDLLYLPHGAPRAADHRAAPGESGRGAADGYDPAPGARRPPAPHRPHRPAPPGVHLWPGEVYTVPGTAVRVAGLPGNFAPTWYERDKPFPEDRVRHFNAADVRRVAATASAGRPAVLLLHEAFRGQAPGRLGAMGVPALADLVARLRPAFCLTGHHHVLAPAEHGPTLALALPQAQEGYARLRLSPAGERLDWEFVAR